MESLALYFHLRKATDGDGFTVRLGADGRSAEAELAFDFQNRTLARILKGIEYDDCHVDDLKLVGAGLWDALFAGAVGELFRALDEEHRGRDFQFRMTLCPELEALPWEALYHERKYGFLSCHPLHSVLRSPPEAIEAPQAPPPLAGKLRVLAAIPGGSGLNVEHEWRNLNLGVEGVRDAVHLEKLAGRVYPDLLAEKLREERWDVFHFIGHGELTDKGRTTIRLNSEESGDAEFWLDGEAFGNLFFESGVRLAVLNCCYAATPSPGRGLSGLGPFLLRAGVPAIIAMRYEIPDAAAVRFSAALYKNLLQGRDPGRVDLAVESARESVHRNQTEDAARPFVTPVLFLASDARLFELAATAAPAAVEAPRPVVETAVALPRRPSGPPPASPPPTSAAPVPPASVPPIGLDSRALRDHGLLDELASVFDSEGAALGLLEQAGVPTKRLKPFSSMSAVQFWESVCRELDKGLAAGGAAALVRKAAAAYPYNQAFRDGLRLLPPPAGQSAPAASAEPADGGEDALALWRARLAHLLKEEAISSDPVRGFELGQRIREARTKIRELGG